MVPPNGEKIPFGAFLFLNRYSKTIVGEYSYKQKRNESTPFLHIL